MKTILISLAIALSFSLNSQCFIEFEDDTLYTCADSDVEFSVFAYSDIINSIDFNSILPTGWEISNGDSTFNVACIPNDGTTYFWSAYNGHELVSPAMDIQNGAMISFDLLFGIQAGVAPCEGPDLEKEGVELQYSIDGGGSWIPIIYYSPGGYTLPQNPNTGASIVNSSGSNYTSWNNFVIPIPPGAATSSTQFKWLQDYGSGTNYDAWGLDNVTINSNSNSIWSTGQTNTSSISVSSPVDAEYIYTINDSLGNSLCSDTCHLIIDNSGFDNNVELIAQPFLASQNSILFLDAFNDGCPSQNGEITVALDPLLTFVSSTPQPNQISGNTLTFNYTDLYLNGPHLQIPITVTTDATAQINDSVNIFVQINEIVGDTEAWNNTKDYIFPVQASYDPNDKKVYPTGECTPGYVESDTPLTYTVRFQNTGTATAYNIKIQDIIDANLDVSSLRIVAASHEVIMEDLGSNMIEFQFNSIYLPHQGADDLGSNGYLVYEIDILPSTLHDAQISNFADIYFDFNPPITTNLVMNTFSDGSHHIIGDTSYVSSPTSYTWNNELYSTSGIYSSSYPIPNGCDSTIYLNLSITASIGDINKEGILVFPNPTNDNININHGQALIKNLSLINAFGKEVEIETVFNNGISQIKLNCPPGIYLLKVTTESSEFTYKIIKI
ncbi:MAG: T9SS type A sorting domain-containing protein [Crocinitomicaceae bacterium]|nr:T9SS type A sorting domain-containing protein [Crocinitomicaceae bacterium]